MAVFFSYFAPLAQPVEQLPFKQKVTGSNPVRRTIKRPRAAFFIVCVEKPWKKNTCLFG